RRQPGGGPAGDRQGQLGGRPPGGRRLPRRRPREGLPDGPRRGEQRRPGAARQPAGAQGSAAMTNHHILSVLVQNRSGVLARVAGLFARRGFNIYSLAVAPAEDDGFSRITICVDVEATPLEQIVKQLFKLIEVVKISELDPRRSVERELLLATVRAAADQRGQV